MNQAWRTQLTRSQARMPSSIETQAQEYLARIEDMGGALQAIETGYIQREIHEAAYQTQKKIEAGEQIVVGVNAYHSKAQIRLERLNVDPAIEIRQRERLKELRSRRDTASIERQLAEIEAAARSETNLMPLFINAVESGATLGEICDQLRSVWGEYCPPSTL
jgi:methylmalonyl-CoA mutase N-terminal domain/subunit